MKLVNVLAYLSIVLAGVVPGAANAAEENAPQQDAGPLIIDEETLQYLKTYHGGFFSDDEATILEYMKNHRVPHYDGRKYGPAYEKVLRGQVTRAIQLFKTGSHEVRREIAQSLAFCYDRGMEFWNMCGKEDYEAKHYLAGLAIAAAQAEQRDAIRRWLAEESHPSYATAVLKNLRDWKQLFEEADEEQEQALLRFLEELYRQPGRVVVCETFGDEYPMKEIAGPVQKYVVKLLPGTPAASELLLEWISRDSKKVDDETLTAMWQTWQRCQFENRESLATRRDLAESWLLCPVRDVDLHLDMAVFNQTLCRQIFNPDARIRQHALKYVISRGGILFPHSGFDEAACFGAIRGASATQAMRANVLREAREKYQELLKWKREQNYLGGEGRFSKLADAIAAAP